MSEPIFYYTLHQKLWNILAEHPGMLKKEALEKYFTDEEREKFGESRCAACEYSDSFRYKNTCDHCPLDVSHVSEEYPELSKYCCQCLHGLFDEWESIARDIICATDNINNIDNIDDIDVIDVIDVKRNKELCSKYARVIMNLKPKEGIKYI